MDEFKGRQARLEIILKGGAGDRNELNPEKNILRDRPQESKNWDTA